MGRPAQARELLLIGQAEGDPGQIQPRQGQNQLLEVELRPIELDRRIVAREVLQTQIRQRQIGAHPVGQEGKGILVNPHAGEIEGTDLLQQVGQGQGRPVGGAAGERQRQGRQLQVGKIKAEARPGGQLRAVDRELETLEIEVINGLKQSGQTQLIPGGRAGELIGAGAAPAGIGQVREVEGDPGQLEAGEALQQNPQTWMAPIHLQGGQGEAKIRQGQVGQRVAEGLQRWQERLDIDGDAKTGQVEPRQGEHQLRQGERAPVEMELGEHAAEVSHLLAGPVERRLLGNAGQGEAEARQVEAGESPHQIRQGQVGPIQLQAGIGRAEGRKGVLGPGGQQGFGVEVNLQSGKIELRQGEQQLGHADRGPIHRQGREHLLPFRDGPIRPTQLGGEQGGRLGREREGVDVEGQVGDGHPEAVHQGRDTIPLGEGGAAHPQAAGGPGRSRHGGDHDLPLDPRELQHGAAGVARTAGLEGGGAIGELQIQAGDPDTAGQQGHGVTADRHRAAQVKAGPGDRQPQVHRARHLEQAPFLGREGEGLAADRPLQGGAGGVEADADVGGGPHAHARQGAAIVAAEAEGSGSEASGTAAGAQQQGTVDATGLDPGVLGAGSRAEGEGGVADGEAELLIGAAGHHHLELSRQGLTGHGEGAVGIDGDGEGSRFGGALHRQVDRAREADGFTALQRHIPGEGGGFNPLGAEPHRAGAVGEGKADRAGGNGGGEITAGEHPTVIGAAGSTGIQHQAEIP